VLRIDTFVQTRAQTERTDPPSAGCGILFDYVRLRAGSARLDQGASLFRRRVFAGCVHTHRYRARARACARVDVCVQGHGRPQNSIFSLICQAVTGKRNSRSLFRAAAANSRQPSGFFRFAFYDRARESPGGRAGIAKSTRKIDGLAFTTIASASAENRRVSFDELRPPRVTEALGAIGDWKKRIILRRSDRSRRILSGLAFPSGRLTIRRLFTGMAD
jgi:hypothetical protein